MQSISFGRRVVFAVAIFAFVCAGHDFAEAKSTKSRKRSAQTRKQAAAKPAGCDQCSASAAASKRTSRSRSSKARSSSASACHPRGYVNPRITGNLNSAVRELKRNGIKPVITSAWRSSAKQASLHNCAKSSRCRLSHGIYGAKPAGTSLHEAGFAVDIAGVATGPRSSRRMTPRGRRIVQVMRKHGFSWRYGLADPAHFEASPTRYGFRSVKQAINISQTRCSVTLASKSRSASKSRVSSKKSVSRNRPSKRSASSSTKVVSKSATKRSSRRG